MRFSKTYATEFELLYCIQGKKKIPCKPTDHFIVHSIYQSLYDILIYEFKTHNFAFSLYIKRLGNSILQYMFSIYTG